MGIAKYHFTVLLSVLSPFCQIHCLPQEVLIIQSETGSWEWLSDAQTKVKEVTDRAWTPACPTGLQYDPCPQFRATSRHWNVQFRGWDGKRKTEVTGGRKDEFQEAIRYYPNLSRVWNCPVPGWLWGNLPILGILYTGDLQNRTHQTELGIEFQPGQLTEATPYWNYIWGYGGMGNDRQYSPKPVNVPNHWATSLVPTASNLDRWAISSAPQNNFITKIT